MNSKHGISFTNIAGISPAVSTLCDVVRLHGSDYEVERLPSRQAERWTYPDKSLVRYHSLGIVAVFITPDFNLQEETQVSVVGAESGCCLQTEVGIHVGLAMTDAMMIVNRSYMVCNQFSDGIDIVPANGQGQTFLGIHHNEDRIEFIGLYHRKLRLKR